MNTKINNNNGDWGGSSNNKKLRLISKLTTINNVQRLIFALIKEGHQIINQILIRKEAIA
jgi:hypothetical protein